MLEGKIKSYLNEKTKSWRVVEITKSCTENPPLMNRKCMFNCVHELKAGRAVAILEVFDDVCHYICMDENGDIYDPTLGWSWSGAKWRLSRYIHPESNEINDAGKMLNDFKSRMAEMLPIHLRLAYKMSMSECI